jgi:hypothetical protein
MAFIGCDFLQIGIKHSTLGTYTLYPVRGENGQIETGGYTTESDPKGITGSGEAIYKQTIGRWVVEAPPIAWKRSGNNTLDQVKAIANSFEEIDCTFELADGTIWIGKGKIVGDIKGATFDATIPLKFEGGGKLTSI